MYTVRELSKLAGVTRRALRYYHQIGLLEPSTIGENGYRYYNSDALLRLQQILLYRELDMPLDEIKRILDQPDFDVSAALEGHRAHLYRRIAHLQQLIETVDHTIGMLKGWEIMEEKKLFSGFSDEEQAAMEEEAMKLYDPEIVKASNQKWKNYTSDQKQKIMDEGNAIYTDFVEVMSTGPSSAEAQSVVERWRQHMSYFWTPNEAQLLALAEGYNSDPRFKANFDQIDPGLAAFVRDAVKVYLDKK
jgi:MerR family transcriptional regulator, thiopeptide resistance regulator